MRKLWGTYELISDKRLANDTKRGETDMGYFEWEIKRGISRGIGRALGNAIEQAVAPTANRMVEQKVAPSVHNIQNAMVNVANQAAKNIKICSQCGEPASVDKVFCPSCGAQLPEETMADCAICPNCGQQNDVGTKFCGGCGTKLPEIGMVEKECCSNCGATFPEDVRFCVECGTPRNN